MKQSIHEVAFLQRNRCTILVVMAFGKTRFWKQGLKVESAIKIVSHKVIVIICFGE